MTDPHGKSATCRNELLDADQALMTANVMKDALKVLKRFAIGYRDEACFSLEI